ncbi:MAG: lysylphosphatidylglycerol synthase transmembrane domain-containing protein [Candidatus Omnitrophota bacterium]
MKKYFRLIGILLFIIIILNIDLEKVWEVLIKANHLILFPVLLMNILVIFFRSLRWSGVVKIQGFKFPCAKAFWAYLRSLYFGNLTPARVGELLRIHYLLKYVKMDSALATSTVIFDKLLDMYLLLIFGLLGFVMSDVWEGQFSFAVKWFFVLMVIVIPVFVAFPDLMRFLLGFLPNYKNWRDKLLLWIKSFFQGIKSFLVLRTLISVLITLCVYLIFFLQCYWLAYSLNLDINFFYLSFCVVLFSILSVLPVSISNIGTRELVLIAMFGFIDIDSESAVSFSLLFFFSINFFTIILGWLAFIFYKDENPDNMDELKGLYNQSQMQFTISEQTVKKN